MKPLKVDAGSTEKLKQWVRIELQRRLAAHKQAMDLRHGLRKIRFGRNKVNLPPLIRELVPEQTAPRIALAYSMGEVVTGAIASKRPRVLVLPVNDADKTDAAVRQKFMGLKDQTMERQARRPIFWKLVDALANDGWGIKKTVWRPWLDFPLRNPEKEASIYNAEVMRYLEDKAAWPIAQRTVDPLTFYPRVGEYGGGDAIESGMRPIAETLRALGLKLQTDGRLVEVPRDTPYPEWEVPAGTSATQRVSEFWNDEMMALIVGGDVFLFENEQGKSPYTWRPGVTTGLNDPSFEGMSAIYSSLTIQPWIDTLVGTMIGWAMLAAIMPLFITNASDAKFAGGPETSEIALGKVVELKPGQGLVSPQIAQMGNPLREMVGALVGFMDRFTPPILQGQAPGRIAGVAASALRESALARLSSLIDNSEQLLAEEDALVLYLIDKVVGSTVYAEGWEFEEASGKRLSGSRVGISPKNINGRYSTLRQLNTESLQDIIAKGTHSVFMKQGGVWSGERSALFSGVDDPLKESIQQLRELLFSQLGPAYAMQSAAQQEPTLQELLTQFLGGGNGATSQPVTEGLPAPGGNGTGNAPGPAPRRGGRPIGMPKGAGGTRAVRQPRGRMT